jgi:hypothetical protein
MPEHDIRCCKAARACVTDKRVSLNACNVCSVRAVNGPAKAISVT